MVVQVPCIESNKLNESGRSSSDALGRRACPIDTPRSVPARSCVKHVNAATLHTLYRIIDSANSHRNTGSRRIVGRIAKPSLST